MNFLFLFLDGVGLGSDDEHVNPFARAELPHLRTLLGGNRLIAKTANYHGQRASLLALDACLGVGGLPQSATGQATLLSGQNVPAALGYHYGPKPNPPVAAFLTNGNLFSVLTKMGKRAALINAYPPRYFENIASGRRMYSAIPLAAISAGLPLMEEKHLRAGKALAADFTAQGWRDHLGLMDTPVINPFQAGERLAHLARHYHLAFFEFWLSDYAGHRQDMSAAVALLETFDQVLAGLMNSWDDHHGLVLITSDHGNLEDLGTRRHTRNPVPALIIGDPYLREEFSHGLNSLCDIATRITNFLVRGA